ncbi:hypothetical protein ABNG03_10660 [Halorubrum sp. RMP-47]|uniref:Uncharacterized protein n=1 Tax=Halorubrum miltondacostae TaxID=3076378 RepID=A0ABD5M7W9_9EURY
MQIETIERAKKIDESKQIIAEIEERVGFKLSNPRYALSVASKNLQSDSMYIDQMVGAMSEAAGYAIDHGHDALASKAIQSTTELEETVSEDE